MKTRRIVLLSLLGLLISGCFDCVDPDVANPMNAERDYEAEYKAQRAAIQQHAEELRKSPFKAYVEKPEQVRLD